MYKIPRPTTYIYECIFIFRVLERWNDRIFIPFNFETYYPPGNVFQRSYKILVYLSLTHIHVVRCFWFLSFLNFVRITYKAEIFLNFRWLLSWIFLGRENSYF